MDLANMRRQGVHHLIAFCLNDACRHQALIDVSSYPDDAEVSSFRRRANCSQRVLTRAGPLRVQFVVVPVVSDR
jgi:hypothetical protein